MILTGDIIDLAKIQLQNLLIGSDENALLKYVNMGMIDLYKRFNLSIKSETVNVVPEQAVYDLKSYDVNLLLHVYDEEGNELHQGDTVNGNAWDYRITNYKTFILHKPTERLLYALYKASPVPIKDRKDWLDIPVDFSEALLFYMIYLTHCTIHSIASDAGKYSEYDIGTYQKQYIQCCQELEMQGYKVPLDSEALSVRMRGYV